MTEPEPPKPGKLDEAPPLQEGSLMFICSPESFIRMALLIVRAKLPVSYLMAHACADASL